MISLNYSELLKKYEAVLISTSRGFDTEYEFLESWVPSIDINQSITDLINAAIDYNISDLELILSNDEINDLNFENLRKKFINSGNISLTDNQIKFSDNKNNE